MVYKAVIFDLDGTLLDTLETLAYYGNLALEKWGYTPYEKDAYRYMVGSGAKNLIRRMLQKQGKETEEAFEKVYKTYIQAYHNNTLYKTAVYPGIKALLEALSQKGLRLGVLSNKPHEATVPILKSFFGENLFTVMRGGMDGVPLKPDPTAALQVAEEMGAKPEECLYVGDTAVDMETGKRAGFYTIGVLWGFRDFEELSAAGADRIIERPGEILSYLEER